MSNMLHSQWDIATPKSIWHGIYSQKKTCPPKTSCSFSTLSFPISTWNCVEFGWILRGTQLESAASWLDQSSGLWQLFTEESETSSFKFLNTWDWNLHESTGIFVVFLGGHLKEVHFRFLPFLQGNWSASHRLVGAWLRSNHTLQ